MDVQPVTRYIRFFSDQGNTMRIWIGSLALALLAGCSLPASLVPGEPNLSKTTTKAPKDYAACLLPLWQQDIPKTTQTSISNGYRIKAPSLVTAERFSTSSNTRTAVAFPCIRDRHGPSPGRCANRCVTACKAQPPLQKPAPQKAETGSMVSAFFCFAKCAVTDRHEAYSSVR